MISDLAGLDLQRLRQRLPWLAGTKLSIDSGVRFTGPDGAAPTVDFRLLLADTNEQIQWGSRSPSVQLLPPGQ